MASFPFKLPSIIPQDLQFIHELVGEITGTPPPKPAAPPDNPHDQEGIESSDSDTDSEREVEADILNGLDEEGTLDSPAIPVPSVSTSDSDTSDSDSDIESKRARPAHGKAPNVEQLDLDEEESGPAVTADAQLKTKNEIAEPEIIIPSVEEVGPQEVLERVGEVMSIVDKVVIVRGSASEIANRASERALDSDTLLVFEDRKVLGYIYETFGPTNQPLYQVRFNQKYPLDPEKVQVSRAVFHVPERSHFVFVRQLQRLKGSDASNVNDEEPADDEVEFSDDEQEAAHKRAATQRREQSRGRSQSVLSSRQPTPTPSQMRDQDMVDDLYGASPYDEPGTYNDMDFGAGPSRPAPIPYDDPYSDSYGMEEPQPSFTAPPEVSDSRSTIEPRSPERSDGGSSFGETDRSSPRGRGRGRKKDGARGGPAYTDVREERGRGWGRGRGHARDRAGRRGERGRGRGRGSGRGWPGPSHQHAYAEDRERRQRSLSPTSLAIARATGQYADGTTVPPDALPPPPPAAAPPPAVQEGGWYPPPQPQQYPAYPSPPQRQHQQQQQHQQFDSPFTYQNQYVQPHINPRFASAFGWDVGFAQSAQYAPPYGQGHGYGDVGYGGGGQPSGSWSDEWTVAGGNSSAGRGDPQNGGGSGP